MTTEYSVSVDDWQDERWEHIGVDTMLNHYENDRATRKEARENGWNIEEHARELSGSHYPIMLYAYPLYSEPSEAEIIAICSKTNCTVVKDTKTDEYYLALSGGGMDLSQDIALAYLYAGERIPTALALTVSTQPRLSVDQKSYLKIMRAIKKYLRFDISNCREHIKTINKDIKRSKEKPNQ